MWTAEKAFKRRNDNIKIAASLFGIEMKPDKSAVKNAQHKEPTIAEIKSFLGKRK